jgi:hypothetical protein
MPWTMRLAIVVAGTVLAVGPLDRAGMAAPRKKDLVLVGTVFSITQGGSDLKPWIVTVDVEEIVSGDFSVDGTDTWSSHRSIGQPPAAGDHNSSGSRGGDPTIAVHASPLLRRVPKAEPQAESARRPGFFDGQFGSSMVALKERPAGVSDSTSRRTTSALGLC